MVKFGNDKVLLFRTQLFLMIFPLLFFPIFIVGYFSYNVSYSALQNRSTSNVDRISALVNQNLDNTLDQVVQLDETALDNQDLSQLVTYYSTHPSIHNPSLEDEAKVENFFLNVLATRTDLSSIDIYTMGNVSFSRSFIGTYDLLSDKQWHTQPWFLEATHANTNTRTIILPPHSVPTQYPGPYNEFKTVISVVQTLVNIATFQIIGAIVININTQIIEDTINNSQQNTDTHFLIYDKQKRLIYPQPQQASLSPFNVPDALESAVHHSKREFTWKNTNYFLSSNSSPLSNWTVVAMVPVDGLMQDIASIRATTLFIIGITLVAAICVFLYMINGMSTQVTQMRQLMRLVETGNLDVRFHHKGRGELITLGHSFNRMVEQLKQSIQENYEAQLQRQKAELAALQSQINPHFLYNTLASLQMIAITEGNDKIARMSYALGQLMRYSLAEGELVQLEQELDNTENFLALMQERYEDHLRYTTYVEPHLSAYKVPKFLLQPLVENAIYHGIDSKVDGGCVQISASVQDTTLVIEIADDGVGIAPEELARLQADLQYEANFLKRSKHLGMCNVQGQIQRLFGCTYGITIASSQAQGTRIMIRLPLATFDGEMINLQTNS